jgi:hypothetical protein
MESHPEEFKKDADRWDRVLVEVLEHADEAEIAAIHASIRNIRLGEAHEDMMDELCNGEERRRKVFEEQEYERNLAKSLLLTKQQMMQQAQQGLQNAYSSAYDVDRDMYRNTTGPIPIANGGTGTLTNTINQIREMLGAKK